jgi:heme/copper-type cytochrome/quinol oxidase subunit 3
MAGDELSFQRGGYDVEPPELLRRNISVGTHLWAAAYVFFFGSFVFVFFYLRELNSSGLWHPSKIDAPTGTGVVILVCVLASAAVYRLGMRELQAGREDTWRRAATVTLVLVLAALAVQCIQWATLSFGPGGNGFASVFVAWTGFYVGVGILGAIYMLVTTLVTSHRARRQAPGRVVAHAGAAGAGDAGAAALTAVGAQSFAVIWYLLALVQVVTFVLLYLVG